MNKRLYAALASVSATSSSARQLAEQLLVNKDPELVKRLLEKIKQLEARIEELRSNVPEPEQISDDEVRELEIGMAQRLKEATWNDLARIDASCLKLYPKFVRPTIARALINKADQLGNKPLDVWLDVIALNGEIK